MTAYLCILAVIVGILMLVGSGLVAYALWDALRDDEYRG